MGDMNYDAACVGPGELYSGSTALREASEARTALLGLGIEVEHEAPFASHVIVSKNGLRVGVIGFSELLEPGQRFQAEERNMAEVNFPTSTDELIARVRELRPDVDVLIVAGRMQPRTLRTLCASELGVDLVLLGGYDGYRFLPGGPAGFLNDTAVACHQIAGYGYSLLTLYLSKQGAVEVQLDTQFLKKDEPIHPDMQRRIDRFYREIGNRHELLADMEPLFAWDAWQRGAYVGAEACRECHVEQHAQWSQTPHARAMETLITAGRQTSPKCVQCHVVGFETESGYRMSGSTPHLADVQCEICHGAGAEHARTKAAADIRRSPPARVCFECHDQEHAESFSDRLEPALESVRH
jgi:cytochrome c1